MNHCSRKKENKAEREGRKEKGRDKGKATTTNTKQKLFQMFFFSFSIGSKLRVCLHVLTEVPPRIIAQQWSKCGYFLHGIVRLQTKKGQTTLILLSDLFMKNESWKTRNVPHKYPIIWPITLKQSPPSSENRKITKLSVSWQEGNGVQVTYHSHRGWLTSLEVLACHKRLHRRMFVFTLDVSTTVCKEGTKTVRMKTDGLLWKHHSRQYTLHLGALRRARFSSSWIKLEVAEAFVRRTDSDFYRKKVKRFVSFPSTVILLIILDFSQGFSWKAFISLIGM